IKGRKSVGGQTVNSETNKQIRPFYWSVRRELWENRSLYLAPLIVAGVIIIGFMFSAIGLAERRQAVLLLDDPLKTRTAIEMPYSMAAMMIMFTAFIVAVFYCLDALHGERRERSILFWKSLPVSDFTTVLSKAVVAIVFFERITFGTYYFYSFIKYRFGSPAATAFNFPDPKHPCLDSLSELTLGRYLTTPGLWIGLAFGIAFLAIAIRMRRYRGPM